MILKLFPIKKQFYRFVKLFFIPPFFPHLYFKGRFKVRLPDKNSFLIQHWGYSLENELFWIGFDQNSRQELVQWEKTSAYLWTKLAKSAKTILDIGANTGVYTLIAQTVNPKAQIFAFEPVERVFDKLKFNINLNQFSSHCINKAISNHDGFAEIFDPLTEHLYSVTVNKNLLSPESPYKIKSIETIRLDTFIEQNKIQRIDLMKIDVETHEPEVLEGMGKYLLQMKPTIFIEILNEEVARKVEDLLSSSEYLFFNIDEINAQIIPYNYLCKSKTFNFLFCTRIIAIELGLPVD
ncbi:MAG: FkbM family methyltransferase [Bacteroidota bacterium]